MGITAELKARLEKAANEDYAKSIAEANIERPPDEQLFKDNKSTAAVVEEALSWEKESERIRKANAENSYSADNIRSVKKAKTVTAEVVEEPKKTTSWGGYGYGYSSSYGSSTTVNTKTAEEVRKEKIDKEIDEKFKSGIEDILDFADDVVYNVFAIKEQEEEKERSRQEAVRTPLVYQQKQDGLRHKAGVYKILLKLCKMAMKISKNEAENVKLNH